MLVQKHRTKPQSNEAQHEAALLTTKRLNLIVPSTHYAASMINFLCRNRLHFKKTFASRPEHYTEKFWQRVFSNTNMLIKNKKSLYLLLTLKDEPKNIIGNICFDGIIRGALHAGFLGFKIGKNYEHQGFMHEALEAAIHFIFHEWNMHRIMANYREDNIDSKKILTKLDFQQEGIAKDYLYINGQWYNHVLTSRINPHWQAS